MMTRASRPVLEETLTLSSNVMVVSVEADGTATDRKVELDQGDLVEEIIKCFSC